jgi:hypothetical protein
VTVPDELGRERTGPTAAQQAAEVETLLRQVLDLVDAARPMPLSTSAMINRDEVLALVNEAIDRLPDELKAARWLLKEREEFLARVQGEGEEILDEARAQAGRMVERTEVAKAAEQRARKTIERAEDEARRIRHEVEDFCDQKLASFEGILDRVRLTVAEGREKLQAIAPTPEEEPLDDVAQFRPQVDTSGGVFDQDLS